MAEARRNRDAPFPWRARPPTRALSMIVFSDGDVFPAVQRPPSPTNGNGVRLSTGIIVVVVSSGMVIDSRRETAQGDVQKLKSPDGPAIRAARVSFRRTNAAQFISEISGFILLDMENRGKGSHGDTMATGDAAQSGLSPAEGIPSQGWPDVPPWWRGDS